MKESKEVTYKRLSAVRNKDSKIEILLRRKLFALGYRYRIHYNGIIGRPDVVFLKQRLVIFCDSKFWHGYKFHTWQKNRLKTNKIFWQNKILRNINRDKIVNSRLKKERWIVLRFWEHQIMENLDYCIKLIVEKLKYENRY